MWNKVLAVMALFGAPFLCVDFLDNAGSPNDSWTTGLYGFFFMTGWMASILGLIQLHPTRRTSGTRVILFVQFLLLLIAQVFNIDVMLHGGDSDLLQRSLDSFWPVSNGFMLVTGIAVAYAKELRGWQRWIPLLTGLWWPVQMICLGLHYENLYFAGFYSAIAWTLLAVVIYTAKPNPVVARMLKRRAMRV